MKDQLQTKLIEILSSAQAVGGDIYEQVKSQAPILAEEIIKWRVVDLSFTFGLNLIVIVLISLGCWVARKRIKKDEKYHWNGEISPINGFFIFPFILMCFCAAELTHSAKSLVQAEVAPRVFFIQSCRELIK